MGKKIAGVLLLILFLPLSISALFQLFRAGVGIYLFISGEIETSAYGFGALVGSLFFVAFLSIISYFCLRYGLKLFKNTPQIENSGTIKE
tara:strand:+ start:870 stop:1139 length:270 start_codon:yes stop_codon:yes gene_type:complete